MTATQPNQAGLTSAEAKRLQDKYGKNELSPQKKERFLKKVFHIICEPMFLLLIAAAIIYFILGEPRDGAIMLIFVAGIISIDVIQEWKTDKTLHRYALYFSAAAFLSALFSSGSRNRLYSLSERNRQPE